jgi:hypothetical protein
VIYRLGMGDLVIKMTHPGGQSEYSHRIYGTYQGGTDDADWRPILSPIESAAIAVQAARRGYDSTGPASVHVCPASPRIALRCPQCDQEFSVETDHLAIAGTSTCPNCGTTKQTEKFSSINV